MEASNGLTSPGGCDCWLPVWLPDPVGFSGVRISENSIGRAAFGGAALRVLSLVQGVAMSDGRSVGSHEAAAGYRAGVGDVLADAAEPAAVAVACACGRDRFD